MAGVSVSAGVCEELIFRGFGRAYVHWLWPSSSALALSVLTGLAPGFAHLYQGRRGVLATAAVGVLLGLVTI